MNDLKQLASLRLSDKRIESFKKYIKNGTFNPTLSVDQKYRLRKQLDNDKFSVENDTLIHTPLNLKIVPTTEYDKILDEVYDKQVGIPSIHDFHNQVNKTYFINRKHTTEYLKKKGDYQISRPFQRKPTNKPVIALFPNQIWEADVMFLNKDEYKKENDDKIGLLNVIDVFSRKVWSFPIEADRKEVIEPIISKLF